MSCVGIMKTGAARTLKVILGAVLFLFGSGEYSLTGLLMTMAAVVLAVTGLAGIYRSEEPHLP